jgi:hypothetical protein
MTSTSSKPSRNIYQNLHSTFDNNCQLSIVILTFNNSITLEKQFHSFNSLHLPYPIEIIVIDNGCFDNTKMVMESDITKNTRYDLKIYYYPLCTNLKYATANNLAVKKYTSSNSQWILFLNDDVVPMGKEFIYNFNTVISMYEFSGWENDIGAVGCKLYFPSNRINEAGSIVYANGKTDNFMRYYYIINILYTLCIFDYVILNDICYTEMVMRVIHRAYMLEMYIIVLLHVYLLTKLHFLLLEDSMMNYMKYKYINTYSYDCINSNNKYYGILYYLMLYVLLLGLF